MPQLMLEPRATTTLAAESKIKSERKPTITIKWAIPRVRSELQLATFNNVKISKFKEYVIFLKRCIYRKIPHFTHAVDAKKKPLGIVILGAWQFKLSFGASTCKMRYCSRNFGMYNQRQWSER
jgi:hypothetical protein